MRLVGKFTVQKEIDYIRTILRLTGAHERQFVRAAVLSYCDSLMRQANELRQEEAQRIIEKQMAAVEQEPKQEDTDNNGRESTATIGDSKESVMDETTDSDALADTQNNLANT